MDTYARRDPGRSGQQKAATCRVVIHRPADPVPDRRFELPLVDEDRPGDLGDQVEVGADRGTFGRLVEREDGGSALGAGRGLAHPLGTFQRDGSQMREDLVEDVIEDPAAVSHASI
ncbi:hypothetical protein SDC9_137499 [bioreactor metagenome]|uniref:Uncharacterized protein n=1 Tax=bioreactor metagenome TaxID=1076179 RepID=A0A645DMQ3_9ZZZZ